MSKFSCLLLSAFAILISVAPGLAQSDYPSRPITRIVPFAAGGPTDVVARIVADHMSRTLGQRVIVENIVGAGGTIGTTRAMRASPDGYTIVMGLLGTHASAPALYRNLAYDPENDFAPIGQVNASPFLVVARKDFPPHELKEFISHVRGNADKVNSGHAGVGSVTHMTCLLFNWLIGVKPTTVPFNGAGPAMTALVAGQIDYMCDSIVNTSTQLQAGHIKAYAITTPQRNPIVPHVPTTTEAGLPDFQVTSWQALFAPKGTPQPIRDRLTAALDRTLDDPAVSRRFSELGTGIPSKAARSQDGLGELLKSEIARWTPIIRAANIKGE
jgi:tripartite-type tricarboxylate transporter receptor subunit TctC